jgi:ABC-type sugar transport system ATPase subunit
VASISVDRVTKTYANGVAAVRDLRLDIASGELLVLVGPSGSGKSTVLRLIAGLEHPTSGRVLIDGDDVTGVPPQRRDLAMVFQNYALYPHKSVRDNLAFGLRLRRLNRDRIEARVQETAAALGIEGLLDRRPSELSGGQRQRVALGRAIVRKPKAFLLDEPLSNLDPLRRVETRAELALLHRRLDATMVYVTHDQEEALTVGNRIAVMRDGAIEQVGEPMALYRRPANTFVAGFIGSPRMNFWTCECVREGGHMTAKAGGINIGGLPAAPFDRAELGVRPQDIELMRLDHGNTRTDATGHVAIVEPIGATTVLHLRLDDAHGAADGFTRVVVASDDGFAIDDRVGIRLRRDRLHVFDPTTHRRVGP